MNRMLPLLLLAVVSSAHASISGGIDRLINQVDPSINIGIDVVDLNSGETIYQRNANRAFIPASNMKVFSDAAALMVLGPDYRFQNRLAIDAKSLKNGVLTGNVYVLLPGDPSFSSDDLADLFTILKKWSVKEINGDVILDSARAGVEPNAPGWMAEDLNYAYGAPLAPVMIDNNRLTVTINPGSGDGKLAVIETDDQSGSIKINNQVKTLANRKGCGVDLHLNQNNELTVRGCSRVGQWAVMQRLAIKNPFMYFKGVVTRALKDQDIVFNGQIKLGKTPKGSMIVATQTSQPLSRLMAETMKPSDNLYADSLFLHAAAKLKGAPVNWGEARPIVKNYLEKRTGISLDSAVMVDGSGLSRYDLLTPAQTVALLAFLHQRFPVAYEFISALPVSGRDGTLQKRFRANGEQDYIRAKTGTMTGVISLSGYLYTANGHTLAFAIFINNLPGTKPSVSGRYRYLVDALCRFLLKQSPSLTRLASIRQAHAKDVFQQGATEAERQRARSAKWRRLEQELKNELKNQDVAVIYHERELILNDNQASADRVWQVLTKLKQKHPIAVAVTAPVNPNVNTSTLNLMWRASQSTKGRVWIIREAS